MSTVSFITKLVKSRQSDIYQLCEKVDGRDAYFIILVHKNKLGPFLKITAGQDYNINDYGIILAWGYEKNPPPEIIRAIEIGYEVKLEVA